MVLETIEQTGERFGAITRVARQLGIGSESLRSWVRQAEIDGGHRPGVTSQEQKRIAVARPATPAHDAARTSPAGHGRESGGWRPQRASCGQDWAYAAR